MLAWCGFSFSWPWRVHDRRNPIVLPRSTPERQSLVESHRQRRWLTHWSVSAQRISPTTMPQRSLESHAGPVRSIIRLHLYLRSQRSFMVILREDTLHLAANIAIFSSPSRLICGIIYFLYPQAEDLVYVCEVLSRRFSCIMLLRLLLLHTVRMTWRIFLCFLTRGLSREYLCE
jgi:hypothetical protein